MSEDKTTRVSLNFKNNVILRVKQFASKKGITDTAAYMILLNYGLDVADTLDNNLFDIINLNNDIKHLVLSEYVENKENSDK